MEGLKKNRIKYSAVRVPYGEIWRTGANEATEVKFYADMSFGRKLVKAGTYVMHTIPGEKEWTIILNSKTDTWGSYFYDEIQRCGTDKDTSSGG